MSTNLWERNASDADINSMIFRFYDLCFKNTTFFLDLAGLGPIETEHDVIVGSTDRWCLKDYGANGGSSDAVLIVASPIKRSYIWDLAPESSAVQQLKKHFHVYMLDWLPHSNLQSLDLRLHTEIAISDAIMTIRRRHNGVPPFLIGHSLGGVLASIYCALAPDRIRALVLLSTPLSFSRGGDTFNSRFVALARKTAIVSTEVPGSLLSLLSVLAAPRTFLIEAGADFWRFSLDVERHKLQARVWHWLLDEVAVPRALSDEILNMLYIDDQLFQGKLTIGGKVVGPAKLLRPTLAVVNQADEVAPPVAIESFLSGMPGEATMILTPPEPGVGLQHLSILIGAQAHAETWPNIIRWMRK